MTAQLVFIHGRSQQHKDATGLKEAWLATLRRGLESQGLQLPISENDVHFPYYGDTLDELVDGVPAGEQLAKVVVKGTEDEEEKGFLIDVLEEAQAAKGVTDEQVREVEQAEVIDKGVRPAAWMHSVLEALDRFVPGVSGPTLAVVTHDVYQYLRNPGVRDVIDSGVREALRSDMPTVVVGHSLGSVVAYNILRKEAAHKEWQIPLLVTVGCPLAVSAITRALAPVSRPPVGAWFNAADPRDIVALWPLAACDCQR